MTVHIHDGKTKRKVRRKWNFERTAYSFMRLSGVGLLFLALTHTFIQLIFNDVHDLTVDKVADNWDLSSNLFFWLGVKAESLFFWLVSQRAMEFLLLILAMSHGLNGLRNIIEDYVHNREAVIVIRAAILGFMLLTFLVVGFAILAFDPELARQGLPSFPRP